MIYHSVGICMGIELVQEKILLYQGYHCMYDHYNRGLTVFNYQSNLYSLFTIYSRHS